MLRLGIIGYGYWGPNLVRNFSDVSGVQVAAVADLTAERLEIASRRNPAIRTTNDPAEVIADPNIDAVAIATPVSTHFKLAEAALRAGKNVLVEKPMCATSEEAERLIETAERRKLTLLVDHTFCYTGAVRKIRDLMQSDHIGDVYYYDSVRINLGLFQSDVNVIWDLAVHDLSILDFILPRQPMAVACTGSRHVADRPADVAYISIYFSGDLIAHVHVSWLSPVKLRRTLIGGNRKMIVYDDIEPYEKVRVHDKGIVVDDLEELHHLRRIGYRSGDVWCPQVDATEALRVEAAHFVRCIEGSEKPITNGQSGLRIVRLLEAADRSLALKGAPVEIQALGVAA